MKVAQARNVRLRAECVRRYKARSCVPYNLSFEVYDATSQDTPRATSGSLTCKWVHEQPSPPSHQAEHDVLLCQVQCIADRLWLDGIPGQGAAVTQLALTLGGQDAHQSQQRLTEHAHHLYSTRARSGVVAPGPWDHPGCSSCHASWVAIVIRMQSFRNPACFENETNRRY